MVSEPYDLVLAGGRVIDPSVDFDGVADVGIRDGRIAAIGDNLGEARRVIDVSGRLVSPGLIDVHAHVFWGASVYGVHPDRVGIRSGVTHVHDVGSTGWITFNAFKELVAKPAKTPTTCYPNVAGLGIPENYALAAPELLVAAAQVEPLVELAKEEPELIRGVKIHFDRGYLSVSPDVFFAMNTALEVVEATENGLYAHLGDLFAIQEGGPTFEPDRLAASIVEKMRPGDMLGHWMTPHPGGLVDEAGKISPAARQAKEMGVLLEVGHGYNACFRRARILLEAGIQPDVVSSDTHGSPHGGKPRLGGVPGMGNDGVANQMSWSMIGTMTKLWGLGVELADLVRMASTNPAKALRLHEKGTLQVGGRADVTVLRIVEGDFVLTDSIGGEMTTDKALLPEWTLLEGEVFENRPFELPEFRNELLHGKAACPPWSRVYRNSGRSNRIFAEDIEIPDLPPPSA